MAFVRRHNETVLESLERGDLVEFPRGSYSHWAVYIGDGQVVHLAGDENDGLNANVNSGHLFTICGQRFRKAFVRKDPFFTVADQSMAKKNNDKDKRYSPKSCEEIVEEALSMLGEIGYNVLWCNCEHFTSLCRYGVQKSEQVEKALTWATVGAAVGAVAVGVLTYAFGSSSKSKNKEEKNYYI